MPAGSPLLRTLLAGGGRFLRLPRSDQWLLLESVATLAAVKLALRWLPLRATQRALARLSHLPMPAGARPLEQGVWALNIASGLVPGGSNCLARALTLQMLLEQRGTKSELRIGFAREASGAVEGHAWLVQGGKILINDLPDLGRFKVNAGR